MTVTVWFIANSATSINGEPVENDFTRTGRANRPSANVMMMTAGASGDVAQTKWPSRSVSAAPGRPTTATSAPTTGAPVRPSTTRPPGPPALTTCIVRLTNNPSNGHIIVSIPCDGRVRLMASLQRRTRDSLQHASKY